jgi:glycine dehydrogenase subunit 2
VDLDDLRQKLSPEVAGMMLTQPNTLGLFEDNITEITHLVHEAGGLMYMDGANLNALLGLVKPADMGFDIVHINLHKTFSTPHGGGGPGSGPIGVTSELEKYLPSPLIIEKDGRYSLESTRSDSVGRVHTFFGNFGILVRAYTYIRMLGLEGIHAISRQAILNANYLMNKLVKAYDIAFDGPCMHEFVLSANRQKERGIRALDIGKRLLDFGFHAPTVYFPLNIPEAMMTEPTDSETKESLDRFAEAMLKIDEESKSDPEKVRNAPYSTPVRRLDETAANRNPNLRWRPE